MSILALGGGPLKGNITVRIAYLDEAGISNPLHEPYVVVAGVIVHGDNQLQRLRLRLDEVREKHIPESVRDEFIFHATEIFNGGKTLKRKNWPIERGIALAEDLASLPAELELPVVAHWVQREGFPQTFELPDDTREKTRAAHAVCFLGASAHIELYMRHFTDENCILVVEDNSDVRQIIRETHNYNQLFSLEDDSLEPDIRRILHNVFPFQRIQEDPLFQPKKQSNPLELADFVAYIYKRRLQGDERYDRFIDQMDHRRIEVDAA